MITLDSLCGWRSIKVKFKRCRFYCLFNDELSVRIALWIVYIVQMCVTRAQTYSYILHPHTRSVSWNPEGWLHTLLKKNTMYSCTFNSVERSEYGFVVSVTRSEQDANNVWFPRRGALVFVLCTLRIVTLNSRNKFQKFERLHTRNHTLICMRLNPMNSEVRNKRCQKSCHIN